MSPMFVSWDFRMIWFRELGLFGLYPATHSACPTTLATLHILQLLRVQSFARRGSLNRVSKPRLFNCYEQQHLPQHLTVLFSHSP